MAPTTRTQAHPTPSATPAAAPPANVLQPTQAVEPSTTQPNPPKAKRGPGRPPKRKAADDIGATPQPASTTQSGSKWKKTKAAPPTTTNPSGDASNSLSTPNPPSAHIPTADHPLTAPNAQPLQPPSLSTPVPDLAIDPALLALSPAAIPQPRSSAPLTVTSPTSDQPLAATRSVPIQPSFPIAPPASASMSSDVNQAQAHVVQAEEDSVASNPGPEATVGPSTRHQAQHAPTLQQALKQLEELRAENKQLHADLRVAKKFKVLYAKEITQKGKVDLPVTGNLIPRPPGEKGKNGWNLQEVLGLKDDFAGYNELLRTVRHCISRSGLNWEATYSDQDAARLGACFKEIKKAHPFLERFVGDWPAKEMVINALQNRRKSLNAKARVKDDESQGTDQVASVSNGVQARGDSTSE